MQWKAPTSKTNRLCQCQGLPCQVVRIPVSSWSGNITAGQACAKASCPCSFMPCRCQFKFSNQFLLVWHNISIFPHFVFTILNKNLYNSLAFSQSSWCFMLLLSGLPPVNWERRAQQRSYISTIPIELPHGPGALGRITELYHKHARKQNIWKKKKPK